jgi:Mlc titration factor MtfA (ptsG expression regulator)
MWAALRRHWQARREAAALARRAIPDRLWRRTLKRFPFLPEDEATQQRLRRLTSLFLDRKEFSGAHGLTVTDDMAVAIAAQACLPVLEIGLQAYDGFVGIVVHPGQAMVRRETADDDGVVHAWDEVLSGEAVQGGPVMLSWRDVRSAGPKAALGYNVVIHEFAHVLDMADGAPDGVPLLPPGLDRTHWERTLHSEYDTFCDRVEAEVDTALDPYGAEAPEEFFAVASEAFFVSAQALRGEHPALYAMLKDYYRQDPADRRQPPPPFAPDASGSG